MDHDAANDSALAERATNGDEAAFNEILLRYQRPILDFVYRMIGDSNSAQDVAQIVFVRAWRGLPRFEVRPNALFSTETAPPLDVSPVYRFFSEKIPSGFAILCVTLGVH